MKRGFTLIELLAVLTILSIILLITIPIMNSVIKNAKEKTREQSVTLYGRAIEDAINNYYVKYPLKTEVTLKELEDGGFIEYKGNKVECNVVQIYERDVYLEDCKVGNKHVEKTYGEPLFTLETEDYKGYYADVDGDGTVDGVIYADLAHPKEETTWGIDNTLYAKYSYPKGEDLKEYVVSKNKYKANDGFGEHEIISIKKGSSGSSRFYVMSLENFTTEAHTDSNNSNNSYPEYTTYYWYYNAALHMDPQVTEHEFSEGKENTKQMIAKWKAAGTTEGYSDSPQNNQDIWKHIEEKYQEGWYIPSLGEWTAFADYFSSKEENKLTSDYVTGSYVENSGNYNSLYGLSDCYWSSSQEMEFDAWNVLFTSGIMNYEDVFASHYVRLGVTF